MVVGITIGSGIFRTPGLVAHQLGRPWLTFVAWLLGGVLAFLGALCFAELATRHPQAGGKYVYAREAFGPRIGFMVGWCEGFAMYPAAIAALGVVTGEFLGRLFGWSPGASKWLGVGAVALLVAINLTGVTSGRWVQDVATSAKVLALGSIVLIAFVAGDDAESAFWSRAGGTRAAGACGGQCRRDAVGGDGVGWHGRDRARRLGHVPAAPVDRDRAGPAARQCDDRGAVSAAGAAARGAIPRPIVSARARALHRRVSRAARGNGARTTGTGRDRRRSPGGGVGS